MQAHDKPLSDCKAIFARCKTVDEAHLVMARAAKTNRMDIYPAYLMRIAALEEGKHADPLTLDLWKCVLAYEGVETTKRGKKFVASRTRQKIARKGARQSLIDWALASSETPGFKALIDANLPQFTGERVVLKHADQMPKDAVMAAEKRLAAHGVATPSHAP